MTVVDHLEDLVQIFEKDFSAVLGRNELNSSLVNDAVGQGHRTRPISALLAAEAAGGDPRKATTYAVSIELTHKASVLRDDISDGDEWRDGKPAFHVVHTVPVALAVSDVLWAHALPVLLDGYTQPLASRLQRIVVDTHRKMSVGQLYDVAPTWSGGGPWPVAESTVNHLKTGSLVAAAFAGGALCVGANKNIVELLAKCGASLGEAFQVLNDVGNLIGSDAHHRRRKFGNTDLRTRRRGPLFDYVMREAESEDRKILLTFYARGGLASEEELSLARQIFIRAGAGHYGAAMARDLLERAHREASRLPRSMARTALLRFCTSEGMRELVM